MSAGIWIAVLRRLSRDDRAQDLIEYALLIGLVAVVAASAVTEVGQTIINVFWSVIAGSIPATP